MLETIKIDVTLNSEYQTTPPKAKVLVAGKEIFRQRVTGPVSLSEEVTIEDGSHNQLIIELFRKTDDDTTIDEEGNIIEDSTLLIESITIDDVDITKELSEDQDLFYYEHSGQRHQLYNTLGVNGQAVINFNSPIYVWLLENIG